MDTIPNDLDFALKVRLADFEARCWVQGVKRDHVRGAERLSPNTGNFHERFCSHPWVKESLREGWHRDLSAFLVRNIKMRLLRGEKLSRLPAIAALMPEASDVANWRLLAGKAREAAEWRERVTVTHGSVDAYLSRTCGTPKTVFQKLHDLEARSLECPTSLRAAPKIAQVAS